jgi:RNA polymerase sigma factor, sigma-70 family
MILKEPKNKNTPEEEEQISKLLKKSIKGDGEAFGELIRKYENFIYNIVYQAIGNRDDAFDVSQEVFIKAFRGLKNFRGDCKFSTWMYKIAVNASKDYIRDKSKRNTVSLSDWTDDDNGDEARVSMKPPEIVEESVDAKPEEAYERNERRELVREAIANLSDDHKNVVVLRDIEGYSYEDISDMLNIEIGTVKSRLNRARNAIKEYLKEWNLNDF